MCVYSIVAQPRQNISKMPPHIMQAIEHNTPRLCLCRACSGCASADHDREDRRGSAAIMQAGQYMYAARGGTATNCTYSVARTSSSHSRTKPLKKVTLSSTSRRISSGFLPPAPPPVSSPPAWLTASFPSLSWLCGEFLLPSAAGPVVDASLPSLAPALRRTPLSAFPSPCVGAGRGVVCDSALCGEVEVARSDD